MITLIILFLFVFIIASIVWSTYKNGISPMPTHKIVKKELINALPESIDGTIYELGSGWGTLAFPLAQKFPNLRVVAFENSWFPYLFSRLRLFLKPTSNLNFYCRDFYKEPLDDAGLVVCYLYPGAMQKLKQKFKKEMTKGWIVSHTFAIPDWKPTKIIGVRDIYHTPIYFYKL